MAVSGDDGGIADVGGAVGEVAAVHAQSNAPINKVGGRITWSAAQRRFDLVEMFGAVRGAQGIHQAGGVLGPQPVRLKTRDAPIGLFGQPQRKPGRFARRDRVDERARGVVDPGRIFGLDIGRRERLAALELVRQEQDACIPERHVPQNAGHRPVLVHLSAKVVVAESLDEGAQPLTLAVVPFDVVAIWGHPLIVTLSANDRKAVLALLEPAQLVHALTRLPRKTVLDDPADVALLRTRVAAMRAAAEGISTDLRDRTKVPWLLLQDDRDTPEVLWTTGKKVSPKVMSELLPLVRDVPEAAFFSAPAERETPPKKRSAALARKAEHHRVADRDGRRRRVQQRRKE